MQIRKLIGLQGEVPTNRSYSGRTQEFQKKLPIVSGCNQLDIIREEEGCSVLNTGEFNLMAAK